MCFRSLTAGVDTTTVPRIVVDSPGATLLRIRSDGATAEEDENVRSPLC